MRMRDSPAFGNPIGPWIRTFALVPHFTFDGGWVWLAMVWKPIEQLTNRSASVDLAESEEAIKHRTIHVDVV